MAVITMKTSVAAAAAAAATKGAAPNVDDNDADNEVKARAAQRREEGRMLGSSDWQDAAVQRNHRVEGFLCVAHIARTHAPTSQRGRRARARSQDRKKEKLSAIKVQSCRCTAHRAAEKRVNKLHRRCRNLFYCTIAACQRQTVVSTANCTPKIFVFEVKSSNVCPSFQVPSSHIDKFHSLATVPMLISNFEMSH